MHCFFITPIELVNTEKDIILLNSMGFFWYLFVGTLRGICQVVSGQEEKKGNE